MSTHESELRSALDRLREVEGELTIWGRVRETIREEIAVLVAVHFDNRAQLPGYGRIELRAPATARVWDSGALAQLAQSLRETGQAEIAEELEACKRDQERAGGLAITREKAQP